MEDDDREDDLVVVKKNVQSFDQLRITVPVI